MEPSKVALEHNERPAGALDPQDDAALVDAAAEKRVVRKLDRWILAWIILLYFVSYLDRSNIGNARNIGLARDTHLSSAAYQLASSTFYIGTVCFGTIGGLMLKAFRPSAWLAMCLVGWGAMAAIQAACTNGAGLAGVRFLLGVFEASFAPGCALYLSFWYLKTELSLRIAAYAGTSALSGVVGGLISYGLGKADGHMALPAWRALFLVEGLPTVAIGVCTYFILPDRPELGRHPWFTEEEQRIILSRRTRFVRNDNHGINLAHVKAALTDYRLALFCLIYAGLNLSLAVVSVYLPTIVGDLGYNGVDANLMTVPIYATAYVMLLLFATTSDRLQRRGLPIAFAALVSCLGYVLLAVLRERKARYGSCILAVSGTYMAFPLILAWVLNTFAADTKGGVGVGVVIGITHAVSVAASFIYPSEDAPQYVMGNTVSASLTFTAAMAALLMMILLRRENHRRDRKPTATRTFDT
ncbi:hypothetical protein VTK73DRAFT_1625 [Phialemonium thermophilum]|uniref:Major facilitator superfamily (MFS) profile domain-containing protein n=1 Tax=Phialemonium thermophilum TaxID=223376 RepID=A0ABR3VT83_9PEZI